MRRCGLRATSPRPSFSASHCSRRLASLRLQLGHLVFDFGEAVLGVLFGFVGELPGGQFQLHEAALHLVDFGRHAFQLHRQPAGGFVHQVDRLVGQEAIGDVAVATVRPRRRGPSL